MSSPLFQQAASTYAARSWIKFPADAASLAWVNSVAAAAQAAAAAPAHAHWKRHGGTWFVGVDALPNDGEGRVSHGSAAGSPLAGAAVDFIHMALQRPQIASHRGQVSVCYPGYPRRDDTETPAAHHYRITRDAAHVDGLHGEGPEKRRHMREFHDFILGIALDDVDEGASPFVVWEGSHRILQAAFRGAYSSLPPESWGDVDVTEIYNRARREVFDSCPRTEVPARKGECYIAHRFCLHGVAPWRTSPLTSRTAIYFRPCHFALPDWLDVP